MELGYGPQPQGLVCGYHFSPGQRGRPLDLQQAAAWVAEPPGAAAGFVWLHFSLSDAAAEDWIRRHLPVGPEFFDALRDGSRSTRIENAHEALVAVINDVAYEFTFEPSEIETLWVHVDPRVAVSARLHPLQSVDRLRGAVREGLRFDSPVALLNHLLQAQADVLVRIARDATLQVDRIEDGLLTGRLQHKRVDLGRWRRVLVRLRRLLAPEPGALFRLLRTPPAWMNERDGDELRQATEEFTLVLRDLSELQERIKLLQEEIAAQLGEKTHRSLFTLTVVTVLALPINIVAGLLGMNVGGIPLAGSEHGFGVVVSIVAVFTLLAGWLAFRRRDPP